MARESKPLRHYVKKKNVREKEPVSTGNVVRLGIRNHAMGL
jgi:hypothetical protein